MFNPEQEAVFAITTIVIALLLAFLIFLAFTLITQRKVAALQKEQLRAEVLAIERERERLASDLHDSLGPTISALIILNQQLNPADEGSLKIRTTIDTHLQQISDQLREISRDLIPRFFKGVTVNQVLRKAVEDAAVLCQHKGIRVTLSTDVEFALSSEHHLHLYRIVQELLHNACKHSKAGTVLLSCVMKAEVLTFVYKDDGVGYKIHQNNTGLGLRNIQNRVNLLGGTYTVHSEMNKGTRLEMKVKV